MFTANLALCKLAITDSNAYRMWFSLALFVTLISAYKRPSVDNNTFTRDQLLNVLDNATRHSENILCVGNLNCDILHPTNGNKPWDSIFLFLLKRHFT